MLIKNKKIGCYDPPPTSQPTDDNPLTDLQDRQRAPLKQLSRCLENRTRIESPMSEISDEAFNGQMELNCSFGYISSVIDNQQRNKITEPS